MTSSSHHHHFSTLQAPPSPPCKLLVTYLSFISPVKVIEQTMARSGMDWRWLNCYHSTLYFPVDFGTSLLLASAAICIEIGVLQIGIRAMVIENKVKTLTITTFLLLAKKVLFMSSSNHPIIVPSDSDIEDAFSSTNVP
ncbi:hypothetical protein Tco_1266560, partial [Tanacetum coccineum]